MPRYGLFSPSRRAKRTLGGMVNDKRRKGWGAWIWPFQSIQAGQTHLGRHGERQEDAPARLEHEAASEGGVAPRREEVRWHRHAIDLVEV